MAAKAVQPQQQVEQRHREPGERDEHDVRDEQRQNVRGERGVLLGDARQDFIAEVAAEDHAPARRR